MLIFRMLLLFLIISFNQVTAYPVWNWQNPLPHGNLINDVHVFDVNKIIAVGDAGTIMYTIDVGVNWTIYENVTTSPYGLNDVFFIDDSTGWIVGDEGVILKSTDGGKNWVQINTGFLHWFEKILFTDLNHGWAVGSNDLFQSTNGGNSWSIVQHGFQIPLFSFHFINENIGWACGTMGNIIKTTDGGVNWIELTTNINEFLANILFINQNTGWAVGVNGTIIKTIDGGNSWNLQSSAAMNDLSTLYFIDEQTGWIAGLNQNLLKTTNGGTNWQNLENTTANNIHFISNSYGWIVNKTNLKKSTDGGINWTNFISGTRNGMTSIDFFDNDIGWITTNGGKVLKTNDGGENWQIPYTLSQYSRFDDIDFVTTQIGWAVGTEHTTSGYLGLIMKSYDGGESWQKQYSDSLTPEFMSLYIINVDTGWVVGEHGTIHKTVDSGNEWIEQYRHNGWRLQYVHFQNSQLGWVVGYEELWPSYRGIILKTEDGGNNWNYQILSMIWNDVYFINENTGWIVGFRGEIRKTIDGGHSWTVQNNPTNQEDIYKVYFIDNNVGWIMTWYDLYKTTDGGVTWEIIKSVYPYSIYSFQFTTEQIGWIVGTNGMILKTTTGGISRLESYETPTQPQNYFLYQNYPNPFNFTTRIKYKLEKQGKVSISIYNLIGQKICTIINEHQIPGEYAISWDGSNNLGESVSSGLYICHFQFNSQVEFRKMLLIK